MNILHLDCSPRGPDSESRRLSHSIVEHLRRQAPAALLVRRAIGAVSYTHLTLPTKA